MFKCGLFSHCRSDLNLLTVERGLFCLGSNSSPLPQCFIAAPVVVVLCDDVCMQVWEYNMWFGSKGKCLCFWMSWIWIPPLEVSMKGNHTWFILELEGRCVLRVLILGIKAPQMAQVSEDTGPISDANAEETQIVLNRMKVVLIQKIQQNIPKEPVVLEWKGWCIWQKLNNIALCPTFTVSSC